MIHVKDLTKKFGETVALDGISFDIAKGEVVGFLGPNGAGKTTTMRILTGFIAPTSGVVEIHGQSVQEKSLATRTMIGYLPENNPLYDTMRVYEYLEFIAGAKKIKDKHEAVAKVVNDCALGEKISSSISDLSKGYRQRVGLAAALLGNPEILILDEPTSGLDPNQAAEIRKLIRSFGNTRTVIFSTHILQEVQQICHRALIIHHGSIVGQGTIDELMQQARGQTHVRVVVEESADDMLVVFRDIDDVIAVERQAQEYIFTVKSGVDIRARIFRCCVSHHWTLLEMQQDRMSLEDIFRQLTETPQ